jgi:hypothetical protein
MATIVIKNGAKSVGTTRRFYSFLLHYGMKNAPKPGAFFVRTCRFGTVSTFRLYQWVTLIPKIVVTVFMWLPPNCALVAKRKRNLSLP